MDNEVAGGYKLVTIAVTAVCLFAIAALAATILNDNRAAVIFSPGDLVAKVK